MMDFYDWAVRDLKGIANDTAKARYADMYNAGLLEQELDGIAGNIESMLAEYLCDGDGDLLKDAEDIYYGNFWDLASDVVSMVDIGADNVAEFLREYGEV